MKLIQSLCLKLETLSSVEKSKESIERATRAIQLDGGSEFEAVFEAECQRRGIKLFFLPPRSPKLLKWEQVSNTIRPNQALNYLTPLQFLEQLKYHLEKEVMCH